MTSLGRVVGRKYRMLYPLGQGGMGSVWVAEHIELGSHVAVKFIDQRLAQDAQARQRFRREAQAAAALRGKHVVQVFDYGIDEDDPYLVMELLEGETLAACLDREGRLPVEDVTKIVDQVASALSRAHERGIVHRDLKPENVFLVSEASGFTVKLLDFGVAKLVGPSGRGTDFRTQPGRMLGTLHYMSPEQLDGASVDTRSDVWALGIVAFECLTGELPVDEPSAPQLIAAICHRELPLPSSFAEVPPGFDAWFRRATEKDLGQREPSIQALAEAFGELTRGLSGKCRLLQDREKHRDDAVTSVIAYSSSEDRAPERSSSIPAAINGRRDINHIALISKISETHAVLWTRHRAETGQALRLTLHLDNESQGQTTFAEVIRVDSNRGNRPEMWPHEITVRFAAPLVGIEQKIDPAGSS